MWLDQISPVIRRIWRGTFLPGFIEPGRYLFDHEVVIFIEGSCQVTVGDRILDCSSGSYLIIPPNIYHITRTGDQKVYRFCLHFDWVYNSLSDNELPICTFDPEKPDPDRIQNRPYFVPDELFFGKFELDSPVLGLVDTLAVRWLAGWSLDRLTARAVLLELLLTLLAPRQIKRDEKGSARDLAHEIKQVLDDLTVSADSIQNILEQRIGLSYAHQCRVFTRTFNMPPGAYLNTIKIERAKFLLCDPRYNVAAVAKMVGYSDPSYFSRIFSQHVGISPQKFARLH